MLIEMKNSIDVLTFIAEKNHTGSVGKRWQDGK